MIIRPGQTGEERLASLSAFSLSHAASLASSSASGAGAPDSASASFCQRSTATFASLSRSSSTKTSYVLGAVTTRPNAGE
jgi:hypothetical protein